MCRMYALRRSLSYAQPRRGSIHVRSAAVVLLKQRVTIVAPQPVAAARAYHRSTALYRSPPPPPVADATRTAAAQTDSNATAPATGAAAVPAVPTMSRASAEQLAGARRIQLLLQQQSQLLALLAKQSTSPDADAPAAAKAKGKSAAATAPANEDEQPLTAAEIAAEAARLSGSEFQSRERVHATEIESAIKDILSQQLTEPDTAAASASADANTSATSGGDPNELIPNPKKRRASRSGTAAGGRDEELRTRAEWAQIERDRAVANATWDALMSKRIDKRLAEAEAVKLRTAAEQAATAAGAGLSAEDAKAAAAAAEPEIANLAAAAAVMKERLSAGRRAPDDPIQPGPDGKLPLLRSKNIVLQDSTRADVLAIAPKLDKLEKKIAETGYKPNKYEVSDLRAKTAIQRELSFLLTEEAFLTAGVRPRHAKPNPLKPSVDLRELGFRIVALDIMPRTQLTEIQWSLTIDPDTVLHSEGSSATTVGITARVFVEKQLERSIGALRFKLAGLIDRQFVPHIRFVYAGPGSAIWRAQHTEATKLRSVPSVMGKVATELKQLQSELPTTPILTQKQLKRRERAAEAAAAGGTAAAATAADGILNATAPPPVPPPPRLADSLLSDESAERRDGATARKPVRGVPQRDGDDEEEDGTEDDDEDEDEDEDEDGDEEEDDDADDDDADESDADDASDDAEDGSDDDDDVDSEDEQLIADSLDDEMFAAADAAVAGKPKPKTAAVDRASVRRPPRVDAVSTKPKSSTYRSPSTDAVHRAPPVQVALTKQYERELQSGRYNDPQYMPRGRRGSHKKLRDKR